MKLKKSIVIVIIILSISLCFFIFFNFYNRIKEDTTSANMNFIINDTLKDGNGEKVKVFLLAGQSNASGVASNLELKNNISESEFKEYENGYSNVFINYYNDNGNNFSSGFTNVKINQGYTNGYFGPELGMGEKLTELYPNEKLFIIKYAWGGSNLHTQWNSEIGNLYKAFIKFTKQSMEYLKSKNYDAEIVSMMWMQGESDATKTHSGKYKNNLGSFIDSIKEDLSDYISNNGMCFIDAYIAASSFWVDYKVINSAKQEVCDSSELYFCIDTIKEGLTVHKEPENNPDLAHYDSLSEIKLGHLFVISFKEIYSKN